MLESLLDQHVQQYITSKSDQGWKASYAFEKNPFPQIATSEILQQIQGRARALKKLPLWAATKGILYPAPLSMEQCSSQTTAAYKANWLQCERMIDVTGGFGVDDYFMAKLAQSFTYCEMQSELAEIVAHNFAVLGATNVRIHIGNSTDYLQNSEEEYDLIYADPARRHDVKGKVFRLEDCTPNVVDLQTVYWKKTNRIALKLSPLMDISLVISQLQHVKEVRTVTYDGELKELLVLQQKAYQGPIQFTAAWHRKEQWSEFSFAQTDLNQNPTYGIAASYLYEPHPGLMKLGPWGELSQRYKVLKWEKNSHLFTSEELITDFPGRSFKITAIVPYSKKEIQQHGLPTKANISIRNFPETVEQLRKKWKIKDGGSEYLFFTTAENQEKLIVFCQKIEE